MHPDIKRLTKGQFNGTEKIPGYLDLRSVTALPEGFNPTVGGYLDLSSVTALPEGFNPTVGGGLYLRSVTALPEGFNPTVGDDLDLGSVTALPEGFNPTVGGGLDLRSVTALPEGFNPTVGGYLDLRSVTALPEGFNPTVGGYLDLGSGLKAKKKPHVYPLTWRGDRFMMVDGILTEVIRKHGMTYRVRKVGSQEIGYLVFNGNMWAHGATLAEARSDLIYKNKETDTSEYKKLTLSSKLTFSEGIACYRAITGACSFGVRNFVETKGVKKASVTVKQIIKMTDGQYGGDTFKQFFAHLFAQSV
jgi:hypothetical protein